MSKERKTLDRQDIRRDPVVPRRSMLAAIGAAIVGGAALGAVGYLAAPSRAAARNHSKSCRDADRADPTHCPPPPICADYDRGIVHDTAVSGRHCPLRPCTDADPADTAAGAGIRCAPRREPCTDSDWQYGQYADPAGQGHHC